MSFHQQSFANRFKAMGDEAEGIFEQVFPKFHRSGICRPPFAVSALSMKDRNTPDYMLADGYVEVMGIGSRNASLKLKLAKAVALCLWDYDTPTRLFVWNSTKHVYWIAPIWDWLNVAVVSGEVKQFPDGDTPTYFDLKPSFFPAEPIPYAPPT